MSVKVQMLKTLNAKECLDDIKTLKNKKQLASLWFKELRDKICKSFEEIENNKTIKKQITFNQKSWERDGGGGGVISIMHGDVFEKVGVNISTVHGKFSKSLGNKYLVQKKMVCFGHLVFLLFHICVTHMFQLHI